MEQIDSADLLTSQMELNQGAIGELSVGMKLEMIQGQKQQQNVDLDNQQLTIGDDDVKVGTVDRQDNQAWNPSIEFVDVSHGGEHSQKLLNMSLDELIEQQSQDYQSDNNGRNFKHHQGLHHHHSYHHQYRGRRGPSGVCTTINGPMTGRNSDMMINNNSYGLRNSPTGFINPLPFSYRNPITFYDPQSFINPLRHSFNPTFYGPHRNGHRNLPPTPELMGGTNNSFQALRRVRLLRAQPYNPVAGLGQQSIIHEQVVAELLRQQNRTREALLLAGVDPDFAQFPGNRQRPKRHLQDAILSAEQSALNESELIYPVLIQDESTGNEIESPDDSLIIRFKGTDVLKVRKSRGDLILNSGGWKTLSTRLVINKALKPLGIWVEEVPSEQDLSLVSSDLSIVETSSSNIKPNHTWRVTDGNAFLTRFSDGVTIGSIGVNGRAQLMARASVIAQHWKQIKTSMTATRRKPM